MVNRIFIGICLVLWVFFAGCSGEDRKILAIGDKAPDFTGTSMTGEQIHLSDWAGSPVILRFWSTECDDCRVDTPVFNRYYEQYKENGLRIVYINTGEETIEAVKEFVAELAIPFPVIMAGGNAISKQYNVRIVPQTIFLDPKGLIMTAILGRVSEKELQKIVGVYLGRTKKKLRNYRTRQIVANLYLRPVQ